MRNRLLKGITLVLLIFTLAGCASNLYVWNEYSKKKYENVKQGTVEASSAYKRSLLGVISSSNSAGKNVPPGIYCELGQLYSKEGYPKQALSCFNKERTLYPESATFVNLIIAQFSDSPEPESEVVEAVLAEEAPTEIAPTEVIPTEIVTPEPVTETAQETTPESVEAPSVETAPGDPANEVIEEGDNNE